MTRLTFHLIANAHLDPVWLWDWREGMNEGIATCKAMLDLMDEYPEFTFVRGEAAIYRHIEEHDPKMFRRIEKRVAQGRWDVVGGTWIQADTNLPSTETFVRQYLHGQDYLAKRFGKPVRVAWAADSFGHAAGLPDVMAGAGITGFAFTRPDERVVPLPLPAFWWEGCGGSRVLSYRPMSGWYGSERHEVGPKLDRLLEAASKQPLTQVGFFYGLGNHGGGASRRHLDEIRDWQRRHPEVEVVHSGLHRLLAAVADDARKQRIELPVHRGELNFCLRGCYASVAKFKWPFRRAEALLQASETLDALASTRIAAKPADLDAEWEGVLFGSFHDILPGSSIERAYDDQLAWLGAVTHRCQRLDLASMNVLASRIDIDVPSVTGDHPSAIPFLVWNPQPRPFVGHIELEGSLDYRPIWPYSDKVDQLPVEVRSADGTVVAHQVVSTEHRSMVNLAWRKRVVVPVRLPALGWQVMTMGWVEGAKNPTLPDPVSAPDATTIDNGVYRVSAAKGAKGVSISKDGKPVFGEPGLGAVVVDDPWGSWGGMGEEPASVELTSVREQWTVAAVELRERGPERACLWVRLAGASSRIDLSIMLYRGRAAVDIGVRVFWAERSARLRLTMPGAESAEYQVPGGSATRGAVGEVPGLRWAKVSGPGRSFGFVSDALSSFGVWNQVFSATVVRASRYADDVSTAPDAVPWVPSVDCGELMCRLLIAPADDDLPRLADELAQPPRVQHVPARTARSADLETSGSFAELRPRGLALLALKPAREGDGLVLRVLETSGKPAKASLTLFGAALALGTVAARGIASWRLLRRGSRWSCVACDSLERPLGARSGSAARSAKAVGGSAPKPKRLRKAVARKTPARRKGARR